MTKTIEGNYFEDFELGQEIVHATPRTVTSGDVALYIALYGQRFAVQCSDPFARSIGYEQAPLDDLLTFHTVFGKTVPDISLNAIANLGYADCRFRRPVFPGATLVSVSEVIGLKENSNRQTGTVYVRSTGRDETGEVVLDYIRWVMVRKRDPEAPAPPAHVPDLPEAVKPDALSAGLEGLSAAKWANDLAGSPYRIDDYEIGEKIDHIDAQTIEEAEHQIATRLFQNTAKVHFNRHTESKGRFGKRIVYGGHVISLARSLSFNGLANAFHIAAINGGRHTAPSFAGDTIYAWSEVIEKSGLDAAKDFGALRIRTVAVKNRNCADFPLYGEDGKSYAEGVVLDLDYWVVMPR